MDKNKLTLNQQIIKDTRHEVDRYLTKLGKYDDDFNGNNGPEYLWDIAKEAGFKTNLEYALNEARKEPDSIKRIETFVELWMESDSYYSSYRLKIERVGNKLFISLAFVSVMD